MFVDTHLHLGGSFTEDVKGTIERALQENVNYFILAGVDVNENKDQIEIAKNNRNIFLSLGYHPDQADVINDDDFVLLEKEIKENEVVAIGEIGLDYFYTKENKDKQIVLFKRQLDLAAKYNLPVIIHTRDAIFDTYNILKEYNLKGVIHCFSESYEMAEKFIELGYYFGIGGVVTFKNSKLPLVVDKLPLERILLETDSPFLSPFRGQKNEPMNIPVIAKKVAEIKGISVQEVGNVTTLNAKKLFNLNI